MARRLAASFLLLVAMSSVLAGPVLAADPDELGLPPRDRPGLELQSGPSPKVHRDAQSAPGANGRIAFGAAPFASFPTGIWSMEANGTDDVQLTPGGIGWGDVWPAYSPGGTMIAFGRDMTSNTTSLDADIFVMQANGSGVKRLTATATADTIPDWTPDGSRLVFGSYRTGGGDVYSMKIDGTDVRRLTTNAANDLHPSVSPDGTRIAFASDRSGGAFDIYTMNMDGSSVARLTTTAGDDFMPDWSPDGMKIAFTTGRTGDYEIFSMNANGTSQANLTQDGGFHDLEPTWSPDGTQIGFWSYSDADSDVYVMAATGGIQTAVGATTDDEWSADWQPIPAFPLVDARFSTFNDDIEWVYGQGITVGCSAERYCPNDPVTREQMAIFLDRALDLPPTATDYFSDDTGRSGEAAINRLRAANITTGCAVGLYCPTDLVSRGQMASFLARAFALPPTATDFFTDDTGTTHEANINRVAAAGITSGCSPTTYCPTASVTRGQMAAFLRRALEE